MVNPVRLFGDFLGIEYGPVVVAHPPLLPLHERLCHRSTFACRDCREGRREEVLLQGWMGGGLRLASSKAELSGRKAATQALTW